MSLAAEKFIPPDAGREPAEVPETVELTAEDWAAAVARWDESMPAEAGLLEAEGG